MKMAYHCCGRDASPPSNKAPVPGLQLDHCQYLTYLVGTDHSFSEGIFNYFLIMAGWRSLVYFLAILPTLVVSQQCNLQFDGRVPLDFTPAAFNSNNGVFDPNNVFGQGILPIRHSHVAETLIGTGLNLGSVVQLQKSLSSLVGSRQACTLPTRSCLHGSSLTLVRFQWESPLGKIKVQHRACRRSANTPIATIQYLRQAPIMCKRDFGEQSCS